MAQDGRTVIVGSLRSYLCVCFLILINGAIAHWICTTPNKKPGQCVPVEKCRPMVDYVNKTTLPISSQLQTALNQYICDFSEDIRLCCPDEPIVIKVRMDKELTEDDLEIDLENPPPPPDVSNHPNLRLLPEDCGYLRALNRIIGGTNAGLNEFPWMALLAYRIGERLRFQCGGTILNEKYILTAAHCVTHLTNPIVGVRIGEHDISTDKDCEIIGNGKTRCASRPVQDLDIEAIKYHPNYNAKRRFLHLNDIALIRVRNKMNLESETARPVCLPLTEELRSEEVHEAILTGWGADFNRIHSNILQKLVLPVLKPTTCHAFLGGGRIKGYGLHYKQLCAGSMRGMDSCEGDSGGPLQTVAFLNDDVRNIQQGILSVGVRACGTVEFPAVYTRVTYYLDWILDNLEP